MFNVFIARLYFSQIASIDLTISALGKVDRSVGSLLVYFSLKEDVSGQQLYLIFDDFSSTVLAAVSPTESAK